MPIETTMKEQA